MFCPHCGKEIPENINFCRYCGKACNSQKNASTNTYLGSETEPKPAKPETDAISTNNSQDKQKEQLGLPCPRCGARNSRPIAHTTTETRAGGYSCCAGACGGILLGPLGLLLGLCGRSASATSKTQTKWVCMDCGAEFMNRQDAQKAINFMMASNTILVQFSLLLFLFGFGDFTFSFCAAALAALAATAFWVTLKKNQSGYNLEDLMPYGELNDWCKKWLYINLGIAAGSILVCVPLLLS